VISIFQNDPPDLVLMDIDMPGMSGIQATNLIKSHFPEVQVLILTVYEDEEKIFNAVLAGASGYL
jgi:DNA-binding NarL/FixJ family response regulator